MRVDGPTQVLGAATVFHVSDDFADQFSCVVTENLGAENFVGFRIGDDLDVTVRGVGGDGAPVCGEIEFFRR